MKKNVTKTIHLKKPCERERNGANLPTRSEWVEQRLKAELKLPWSHARVGFFSPIHSYAFGGQKAKPILDVTGVSAVDFGVVAIGFHHILQSHWVVWYLWTISLSSLPLKSENKRHPCPPQNNNSHSTCCSISTHVSFRCLCFPSATTASLIFRYCKVTKLLLLISPGHLVNWH